MNTSWKKMSLSLLDTFKTKEISCNVLKEFLVGVGYSGFGIIESDNTCMVIFDNVANATNATQLLNDDKKKAFRPRKLTRGATDSVATWKWDITEG
jgi:hypothetical protein